MGMIENDKWHFKLITETSTICLDITWYSFLLDSDDHQHRKFNQREGHRIQTHIIWSQSLSFIEHCRYLNNSTEQTITNKTSQFRTVRQRLRLMQASSARGLNLVQVKGLILGLWDLQCPLKFNLLIMINEL